MTFPIAYIAGQFPKRSETFVYREVLALRARGWTVHTFGLHSLTEETPNDLTELRETTNVVYRGAGTPKRVHFFGDLAAAIRVEAGAYRDAVVPSEPLSVRNRAALVLQSVKAKNLGWRLRQLGVRHVHAHFAHSPASVAMYAAQFIGIPFSFTGHANDLFQRRQLLGRKLARAAFVGCISEWHRDMYRSIVPGDDLKYPIIRCGVDTDELAPTPHNSSGPLRLLTVCRLVEKKGVDTIVRAVAMLRSRNVEVELTVAGDGPMRGTLASLAAQLNVVGSIRFLGALDSGAVRDQLRRADAFALACRVDSNGDRDGIPVVLMEAMACGLPVISGDLPAIRELVNGTTGLLVPGGDVVATAAAIERIAIDPTRGRSIGDAGRQWVVDRFSLRGTVAQLVSSITRAATVRP